MSIDPREAAQRINDPNYPTGTAGFIADAVTVARALLAVPSPRLAMDSRARR